MTGFKPLLAEAPSPRFPLRFPFYASPKYDGIRCVVRPEGAVTRKLKPIPNRKLRAALDQLPWLDGELVAGPPNAHNAMQATTTAVMSHEGDYSQVKFYVFDHTEAPERIFTDRYVCTIAAVDEARAAGFPVELVKQTLIINEADLNAYEELVLAQGYEGAIIRGPSASYKFGRSTAKEQIMLKIKRFVDTEGTVVGFYEQMENTNELLRDELGYAKRSSHKDGKIGKGTLGGMIVSLDTGRWAAETVEVGTGRGWTEAFRQEVWDNRAGYLGRQLKYKFQECGSKDRPRLPIALGWRHPDDMGEL